MNPKWRKMYNETYDCPNWMAKCPMQCKKCFHINESFLANLQNSISGVSTWFKYERINCRARNQVTNTHTLTQWKTWNSLNFKSIKPIKIAYFGLWAFLRQRLRKENVVIPDLNLTRNRHLSINSQWGKMRFWALIFIWFVFAQLFFKFYNSDKSRHNIKTYINYTYISKLFRILVVVFIITF